MAISTSVSSFLTHQDKYTFADRHDFKVNREPSGNTTILRPSLGADGECTHYRANRRCKQRRPELKLSSCTLGKALLAFVLADYLACGGGLDDSDFETWCLGCWGWFVGFEEQIGI